MKASKEMQEIIDNLEPLTLRERMYNMSLCLDFYPFRWGLSAYFSNDSQLGVGECDCVIGPFRVEVCW